MKTLFVISFLFAITLFAQENPWEPKKAENPWATETEKEKETASDSLIKPEQNSKTEATDEKLLIELKKDAKDQYKAGGDFAVGFTSGFVLNYAGALVATIYSLPNNKQEKRIVEAVTADSTYSSIDSDLTKKEAKNAVKGKKILYSLLGTATGAIAQIAVILALIN